MQCVCVILPADRFDLLDNDCLRDVAELQVHHIPYTEPPAVRQARRKGQLTAELAAQCPTLTAQQLQALASCEFAIARDLPLDLPTRARKLRWVQAFGAGIEQLNPRALHQSGIILTNASGVAAMPIAEFVLAQVLALWKELRVFDRQQRERLWLRQSTRLVAGKTLGVVGLGAIGRATAERARAFGMRVLATSRRAQTGGKDADADMMFALHDVDKLLSQSDVVLASMPSTADTLEFFNGDRFAAFKAGSVFCNISRGAIVDERALIEALNLGRPANAVLDVTAVEPNPPDSPLWDHPNVYLSPHASTSLEGYGERLTQLFVDNLERWRSGRPLRNVVNPDDGY